MFESKADVYMQTIKLFIFRSMILYFKILNFLWIVSEVCQKNDQFYFYLESNRFNLTFQHSNWNSFKSKVQCKHKDLFN